MATQPDEEPTIDRRDLEAVVSMTDWPDACGVCGGSPVVNVWDAPPGGEPLPVCVSCDVAVGAGAWSEGRRGYRTRTGWSTARNWWSNEDDLREQDD
jgi:hypothetical protein